ncbi:MAG: twin-arginine translocase subunit TatC [Leptospiraceae bacterium]|nr:twin-arginine translocase subunit TatC [Leptospiraceae bacterium]MCP5493599.1 twin-arginine translocase subunit TatC [Leptospiraceae bacterium]
MPQKNPITKTKVKTTSKTQTKKRAKAQIAEEKSVQKVSRNELQESTEPEREKYMTLGEHLEELRQRIIKGLLIVTVLTIIGLFFGEELHKLLSDPYKRVLGDKATFSQIKLMAPLMIYLKTSFMVALLLSFPILLFLVWGFIAPAMDKKLERHGNFIILFSTVLFWFGVVFCWFTVFENMLKIFMVVLHPPDIDMKLPIDEYYDTFFSIHLIFGVAFQLPVVLILLGYAGIISSGYLISKWREVTIILSIVSAVLSPGPDIFSMLMLFIPLLLLFFLSIFIIKFSFKK